MVQDSFAQWVRSIISVHVTMVFRIVAALQICVFFSTLECVILCVPIYKKLCYKDSCSLLGCLSQKDCRSFHAIIITFAKTLTKTNALGQQQKLMQLFASVFFKL